MDMDGADDRNDGRSLVGQMLAYDKHMNFVLSECEEFRTVKVGFSYQFDPSKLNIRARNQKTHHRTNRHLPFNKNERSV